MPPVDESLRRLGSGKRWLQRRQEKNRFYRNYSVTYSRMATAKMNLNAGNDAVRSELTRCTSEGSNGEHDLMDKRSLLSSEEDVFAT
jgi:hypothetical protein